MVSALFTFFNIRLPPASPHWRAGVTVADYCAVAFVIAVNFAVNRPGYAGNAFGTIAYKVADGVVTIIVGWLAININWKNSSIY
jgi:hypothetical protein